MTPQDFGTRLGEAMEAAGFSKLAFAREMQSRRKGRAARGEPPLRKVDRPALYTFLDGRDVPPMDTLAEMSEVLQVRLAWLAEGEEPLERDLPPNPVPIWLLDGLKGSHRQHTMKDRVEAREAFEKAFFPRSQGYWEVEDVVRLVFDGLFDRRLARRRGQGDPGVAHPEYRANAARGLFLKCFLDVKDELPGWVEFSSPEFTAAFLEKVSIWIGDERK
jgi:transcriptional regulator with XRE-family HTH domain